MSFVDVLNLPSIADPQLSPDGKRVLFVLDRPDWKANRRLGHIFRINSDGTDQVQLTFGERGETSPRWSPDGRSVAFLARRQGDDHNQVYLLALDGGEARRITTHPTPPRSLTWAPDGASLLFTAADAKSAEEKEKDRLQDDVYSFEETNFKQDHLWRTDLDGKATRLTEGAFSVRSYALSGDGRRLTMMRAPSPLLEHSRFSEVWVMDVSGGATQLTKNVISESNALLSPDGTTVAFTADANEKFESYFNDKIFLVPAAGGQARVLMPEVAYEVNDLAWAPDGRSLFFLANVGVRTELFRVDVATRQATPLTQGEHSLGAWTYAPESGLHVFTRNTPTRPAEVYMLKADGSSQPSRVTNVFEFVERDFKLARQERFTWKGQDGQGVEGLLYYPVDYVEGQKYPLIVSTHGGPASSDKFGFGNEVQVYTARGFAVLKPNYRGSTGYGDAFLRDMVGAYFRQSHLDVMAGTDAVIAKGLADPAKLIKMGWSAGGHMTNKIITFTDR
ncbi:MAG: prolyl oligopeptidase family serine peptidase, partial [Acidobacteriota bacterium]